LVDSASPRLKIKEGGEKGKAIIPLLVCGRGERGKITSAGKGKNNAGG